MKKYLILVFCFVAISCSSSSENAISTNVIMPLEVGNEWDYIEYGGVPYSIQLRDTNKIVRKFLSGIVTTYINQDSIYFENRTDGVWLINHFYGPTGEFLLAKYPTTSGDLIRHDTTFVGSVMIVGDNFVDSTNAIVTVPSGTYACYKYTTDYYDTKDHLLQRRDNSYYAMNVGLIQYDLYWFDIATMQLKFSSSRQLAKVILH